MHLNVAALHEPDEHLHDLRIELVSRAGHSHVGDQPRRGLPLQCVERLLAVSGLLAGKAVPCHEANEHPTQPGLVVCNHTPWFDFRSGQYRHRQLATGHLPGSTAPAAVPPPRRRPRAGLTCRQHCNPQLHNMTRIFDEDLDTALATRAIHAGQRPEPLAGAIMTPVYLTSTYVQDSFGTNKGYEYARGRNPTREALERNVASLEGARHGFAFSSGMGCLDSIMKLYSQGNHIVCSENLYGGTFRLFERLLTNFGLRFSYVDTRDAQRIEDAIEKDTVAVLIETPTNPLMWLTDLAAAG